MAISSENQLKDLVLRQINNIKGLSPTFTPNDSVAALDFAKMECGFEYPTAADTRRDSKLLLMINRMRKWYYDRLREHYILRFDTGDLRARQIVENLQKAIQDMDKSFAEAMFSGPDLFGATAMVHRSGIFDDYVGEPYVQEPDS